MRALILFLMPLSILLCANCASSAVVSPPHNKNAAMELTLDTEVTRSIKVDSAPDVRHTISLEDILDSRCPANAKCIWAGELAAELTIERENLTSHESSERSVTLAQLTTPSVKVLDASLELIKIDKKSVTFRFKLHK